MDLNKKVKDDLRANNKRDSLALFKHAWRKILWFNKNCEIDDLQGLYDSMVSEAVNNPRSSFYIHGV